MKIAGRDRETGSQQQSEEATKNSVVTKDIKSRPSIKETKQKTIATINCRPQKNLETRIKTLSRQTFFYCDMDSLLGHNLGKSTSIKPNF